MTEFIFEQTNPLSVLYSLFYCSPTYDMQREKKQPIVTTLAKIIKDFS